MTAGVPYPISGGTGWVGSGWAGIGSPPVLTTISLKVKVNPHLIIFSRPLVMLINAWPWRYGSKANDSVTVVRRSFSITSTIISYYEIIARLYFYKLYFYMC